MELNSENIMKTVEEMSLSMRRFGFADYMVFVLMLFMCLLIGFYWGFMKKQTKEDYLMGGRNMKILPVSLSLVASFISGISLLGTPTEIYLYGLQYTYIIGAILLMGVITIYVFLPVFHGLNLSSVYEYLEIRFDKWVRLFGSVLFTISMLTWLPIVIYVPALAFNQVTGINVHIITPAVCIICIFYTCVGGIQAVVWTDVIQTVIMFGSMIVVVVKGTMDIGGFSVVVERNWESGRIEAPNWDLNPMTRNTVWGLVIGACFNWLNANAVGQSMVQRYLSLPNLKSAQKSVCCFVIGVIAILGICAFCGMLIYATYHDCDPLTTKLAKQSDQLLPLLVMDILGSFPGFPGLFVAGVFSAALSSLSTALNSMAAVVLEDFYKPFSTKPLNDRQTNILMKSVVVVLGVICVGLVFVVEQLGSTILQLSISLSAVANGPSLGIFIMGVMIPKIHSKGALIGGISSLIVMMWSCLGTQTAIARGLIKFDKMPLSTSGCQYLHQINSTISFVNNDHDLISNNSNDVFWLFRLSYMWYTLVGTTIAIVIALIVSILWKPSDEKKIDKNVLAPFLRKYYDKSPNTPFEPRKKSLDKCNTPLMIIDTKIN